MADTQPQAAELIPMDRITVVNPRARNRKIIGEIVDNIAEVGLKRPITFAARNGEDGLRNDLVCGHRHFEALKEIGQTEISAILIDSSGEDCLVTSPSDLGDKDAPCQIPTDNEAFIHNKRTSRLSIIQEKR